MAGVRWSSSQLLCWGCTEPSEMTVVNFQSSAKLSALRLEQCAQQSEFGLLLLPRWGITMLAPMDISMWWRVEVQRWWSLHSQCWRWLNINPMSGKSVIWVLDCQALYTSRVTTAVQDVHLFVFICCTFWVLGSVPGKPPWTRRWNYKEWVTTLILCFAMF